MYDIMISPVINIVRFCKKSKLKKTNLRGVGIYLHRNAIARNDYVSLTFVLKKYF